MLLKENNQLWETELVFKMLKLFCYSFPSHQFDDGFYLLK